VDRRGNVLQKFWLFPNFGLTSHTLKYSGIADIQSRIIEKFCTKIALADQVPEGDLNPLENLQRSPVVAKECVRIYLLCVYVLCCVLCCPEAVPLICVDNCRPHLYLSLGPKTTA